MNPYRTNAYDPGTVERPSRWYQRRMPAWLGALVILCVATGVRAQTAPLRLNGLKIGTNDTTIYITNYCVSSAIDGVTDNTTCIQAALTAAPIGARVIFPPGKMVVTSTLTTPTFVTLEGPGFFLGSGIPAPTQIKFTTGASTLITAGTNITIKNLFLEGPGTGTAISSATHLQCDHAQFDNWGIGVTLNGSFYTRMNECEFHADAIGIQTTGVYNLDLYGVIFRLVPTAINVTDRIASLNMYGGSVEGWTAAGAIIPGANSLVSLFGVYFESSVGGTAGTIIKNNGTQNTFVLLGNQVYLTEASKWFDGNGQDKTTLYARGNKYVAAIGSTVTPTAYTLGINATGGSVDIDDEDWTSVAKVGSVFISGGVTAGYRRTVDTTGALTLTPGAASTITTVSGALTLTSPAAATWSTSSGGLTITSAGAATWSTTAGALTLTSAAAATWDNGGGTVNSANLDTTSAGGTLGVGATRAGTTNIGSTGNQSLITIRANTFNHVANAISAGTPTPFTFSTGAYTNITASAESIGIDFNGSPTASWSTGNFATQREYRFRAPTYQANGASTITDAATVDIVGAPTCNSNMTCTNKWALRVEAGGVGLGDATVAQATNVNTNVTVNGASVVITTQSASTAARTAETGFTVTNSATAAASVVNCRAEQYSGTLFTNGQPDVDVTAVAAGSFNVRIINRDATSALSGTMKIHCNVL